MIQNAFVFHDINKIQEVLEPGEFSILIGSSSKDMRLKDTIHGK